MTTYVVNEMFRAFQGEGDHMGRDAVFIRLHGCDQQCPWCDAAGTWHPDWKTKHERMDAAAIVARFNEMVPFRKSAGGDLKYRPFVVITGGEPTLYDLAPLVTALHNDNWKVHLETAGHHEFCDAVDWVTLSPKMFATKPFAVNIARAHEFKFIISSPDSIRDVQHALMNNMRDVTASVWLHPEWSKRNDPDVLRAICDAVAEPPLLLNPIRAGWQLHKLYSVDQLSPTSDKREIPLGGVGNEQSR